MGEVVIPSLRSSGAESRPALLDTRSGMPVRLPGTDFVGGCRPAGSLALDMTVLVAHIAALDAFV